MPTAPGLAAGPLSGLRVVELSSFVAAPLAGMTLRQLGADVLRIDPPGGAADIGRWPLAPGGTSLFWAGLNKGKRSLELDVRQEAGRQVVRDLLATAPPRSAVLLTNIAGPEWLAPEALRAVCPDLIHVEIRGGHDGTPAVDYTVNAATGFPLVTGPADHDGPVNHVLPAWDLACGLYAALAVAAAARRREQTGEGDAVGIALADVALATAGNLGFLAEAEVAGVERPRIGNHLYGSFARDFACADGARVMVVALTPRHWRDLVAVTGIAEPVAALEAALGADFTIEGDRYRHRETLAALMEPWFAAADLATVTGRLAATSVLSSPYRSFAELVADLRAAPHPLVTELDGPGVGRHLVPGIPARFASGMPDPEAAPALGADTTAVLRDVLGLPADRIAELTGGTAGAAADR